MTEQAQKIWEAFCGELIQEPTDDMKEALATAIRAAADIPSASAPVPFTYKLLDIANELEGK